jgi:hypothetical protein
MTFAEMVFFCLFVAGIYYLLRPFRRRLERWIYLKLTSNKPGSEKPIIDINDYKKKD